MGRRGIWRHRTGAALAVAGAIALGTGVAVAVAATRVPHNARPSLSSAAAEQRRLVSERDTLSSHVTFTPARDAANITVDTPVTVDGGGAHLKLVVVTATDGTKVGGIVNPDATTWHSTDHLAPGMTYHIDAQVVGADGVGADVTSAFSTLAPAAWVGATLYPDGVSVGVAQPVVIRFDHPITTDAARMTAISHFTVTESHVVPSGWHWFSPTELHLRPKTYWPSGEHVTVSSNLDGWDAGGNRWGQGQHHIDFTVGDARISTANLDTHQMTVTDNGKVVATYPMSGGRPKYPTMNGHHIVLDRESVVHMVSSSNGIPVNSPDGYDELVYLDVHISDSGEYVHAAPWSVTSQGQDNVSHGCINLSNADAMMFFNFSRIGDLIEVVGGPRPPELGDHGVMDWDTPWNQWTPASVQRPPTQTSH